MKERRIIRIDKASADYPEQLRNIPRAPEQIYCLGDASLLYESSAGVVGSRKYTLYGKTVAMMVGKRLAEAGVPVVSGLAIGIDVFSHMGMLEAGGRGIGVLGSGINRMGPEKNRSVMMDLIDAGGLIVSEYDPDYPAQPWTFPARNRIISGLSDALIVIEANHNSGALITAQCANEQGRPVYAVPGNINSQFSLGSNLLIRDGATPLVVIDDIIRDLGYEAAVDDRCIADLGEDEIRIFDVVRKNSGVSPDDVARALKMRVSEVNSIVTVMEIKGVLEVYSGKIHLAKGS